MPANNNPIFPAIPAIGIATFTAAAAITSRANIAGTAGLTQLTPVSTNGKRVDAIMIKAKGVTVATNVFVWLYNGVTSFLIDELDVSVVNAANTTDSFTLTKSYANLVLPPTYQLFVSETVQCDLNLFALGGDY